MAPPPVPELPVTGSSNAIAIVATIAVALGCAALVVARRKD